jgi:hypothetical protein
MITWIKKHIRRQKYKLAFRWIGQLGLIAVRIETRAGTDYLHCPDGTFRKIGRGPLAPGADLKVIK